MKSRSNLFLQQYRDIIAFLSAFKKGTFFTIKAKTINTRMFPHDATGQTTRFYSRVPSDSHQKGAFCMWLHSILPTHWSSNDTLELCPVRRAYSSPGDLTLHQPAHTHLPPPELQVTQTDFTQVGSEEQQCFWGCSNPSDLLPSTNWEKHFQIATEVTKN